jgi:hypothetical protein
MNSESAMKCYRIKMAVQPDLRVPRYEPREHKVWAYSAEDAVFQTMLGRSTDSLVESIEPWDRPKPQEIERIELEELPVQERCGAVLHLVPSVPPETWMCVLPKTHNGDHVFNFQPRGQILDGALLGRFSLALRATAVQYLHCEPRAGHVLETLAGFLDDPKRAAERLKQEDDRLGRLGLVR